MRYSLPLSIVALLALAACNEPTPKPQLPSAVTAPITQPARPDLTLAPGTAACPPQPVPICPPAASAPVKAASPDRPHKAKAVRVAHRGKPARHAHGARHHHGHHHPAAPHEREYARVEERQEHYHYGHPPAPQPQAAPEAPHMHAYGQDGAVAHFAQDEHRRTHDRYSGGGGYARSEHRSAGAEAHSQGHAYRSEETYSQGSAASHERHSSSAYSESRSESWSNRSESHQVGVMAHGGCCRGGPRDEAAGRDAYGYLTWPGKVPARP
jgi:hypothetical protein